MLNSTRQIIRKAKSESNLPSSIELELELEEKTKTLKPVPEEVEVIPIPIPAEQVTTPSAQVFYNEPELSLSPALVIAPAIAENTNVKEEVKVEEKLIVKPEIPEYTEKELEEAIKIKSPEVPIPKITKTKYQNYPPIPFKFWKR